MNWPFVSRRAFDEVQRSRDYFAARVEALTADLLAMRRDGFDVRKPAKITEPADEESVALRKAEGLLVRGMKRDDQHFIKTATARIVAERGVSESVARAEAMKLRRSVTDEDAPV